MRRLVPALLLLILAAPATAGAKGFSFSTSPRLSPAFSPSVKDYVVRCGGDAVYAVSVKVRPHGARASIDGSKVRRRAFRRFVSVGAGSRFTVRRLARHGRGVRRTYNVRCLPGDFPRYTYTRHAKPAEAYDIVTPSPYVAVFDRHGAPVWWEKAAGPLPEDAKLFSNGTIGWYSATNPFLGPDSHEIHRLDGKVVRRIRVRKTAPAFESNPIDAHDIQELPNGDFLVADYKRRAGTVDLTSCGGPASAIVYDAEVQRVRPGRADPVWLWNSKDHIAISESARWCKQANVIGLPDGTKAYDVVHLNSMQLRGDDLLMSFRHVDGVYDVSYKTGAIRWKLGGTPTPQSLRVVGDPLTPTLGGQHLARFNGKNTITLHDNGTFLGRGPRGLELRIDRAAGTATVIDEQRDPLATSAFCCGSAQRFKDGAWLASWGGTSLVTEFGPKGNRRFLLRFKGMNEVAPGLTTPEFSYRVAAVMPGELSRRALRAGMDAMHPR